MIYSSFIYSQGLKAKIYSKSWKSFTRIPITKKNIRQEANYKVIINGDNYLDSLTFSLKNMTKSEISPEIGYIRILIEINNCFFKKIILVDKTGMIFYKRKWYDKNPLTLKYITHLFPEDKWNYSPRVW